MRKTALCSGVVIACVLALWLDAHADGNGAEHKFTMVQIGQGTLRILDADDNIIGWYWKGGTPPEEHWIMKDGFSEPGDLNVGSKMTLKFEKADSSSGNAHQIAASKISNSTEFVIWILQYGGNAGTPVAGNLLNVHYVHEAPQEHPLDVLD